MERDLKVGQKIHPKEVISSKDVAVIECDVENPPDNPRRCPTAFTQVAVYREGKIYQIYWHLASRPAREGSWEESLPPAGD